MAGLAQIYQISHGTIGFVKINVMHCAYNRMPIGSEIIFSQIGALAEFHPALFTAMICTFPHLFLDQSPDPQVRVNPRFMIFPSHHAPIHNLSVIHIPFVCRFHLKD